MALTDSTVLKLAPDPASPAYRTAPHNIEAEQGLLGAILVNNDAFDRVSEPARFAVEGAGRSVEVEFLRGYPCAQVFAPLNATCICFEPMAAPPNALRSGLGLRTLAPGESAQASFSLRVRGAKG